MKSSLRLTLVAVTVGGGFSGINMAFVSSFWAEDSHPPRLIFLWILSLMMYTFVFVSGLLFVQDQKRTLPMLVALALQVPWVSSSVLLYQFSVLGRATLEVGAGDHSQATAGIFFNFGSFARFGGDGHPFRVGVNVVALSLIYLLIKSERNLPAPIPISD